MVQFNAQKEVQNIIKFVQDYYTANNLGGVVIGISGGKDSGVVAGLMCRAIGAENVLGVWMPCYSKEQDKEDAKKVADKFGFKLIDFDITPAFEAFKLSDSLLGNYDENVTQNSDINLKPRLRMATLYYLAAKYSQIYSKTYIVAGTSNKSELYVNYFTKGGDSVHDIALIADYFVDEVIKIGECIQVPPNVLYKTPDDGLSGISDEEKLGVTYAKIKAYVLGEKLQDNKDALLIEKLHNAGKHKFHIPTYRRQ